jgi:hypothetical protein
MAQDSPLRPFYSPSSIGPRSISVIKFGDDIPLWRIINRLEREYVE